MKRQKLIISNAIARMAFTCVTFNLLLHCVGWNSHAAIINLTGPKGGEKLACKHIMPSFFEVSSAKELGLQTPHREYHVGLSDLASGKLLSKARPGGWKYLLLRGTNAVGAVVLNVDEKTGMLDFNALQQPGFAKETLEALQLAKEFQRTKTEDYEPRFLHIVGASFLGLWFHGKSNDFIIPFPPTFERYHAYRAYSEEEIIKLLRSKAERNLEMWEELRRQRKP